MKRMSILSFGCLAIVLLIGTRIVNADDAVAEKILQFFPQADKDGDGVLSEAEAAAVSRTALKRFPQADADGDGVLSDAEKRKLFQRAATRAKQNAGAGRNASSKRKAGNRGERKTPSFANVKYGEHERHVFDLWLADTPSPAPLAIYIHGGGFRSGSKEKLKANDLSQLLESGISVASINYRYATTVPLPAAHHDARRALQFIRSKAGDWNIDKDKVAVFGGSAGAQICMWLAYSDEMANPDSDDPVEKESTRITCVATAGGQTTMDMDFWAKHMQPLLGNEYELEKILSSGASRQEAQAGRLAQWGAETTEEMSATVKSVSALSLISADDPPIFMSYGMKPTAAPPGDPKRARGWLIHHVFFGFALKEKTDALNVEADLRYPGSESKYESTVAFFTDKLLEK